MEKITRIRPAYDKRNDDPKKDYGIGPAQVYMGLVGKQGAISFSFSTGMYLEKTEQRLAASGSFNWEEITPGHWYSVIKPMGYDVSHHSKKPLNDYQKKEGPSWPKRMTKKKTDETGMTTEQKIMNVKFVKIGKKAPNCDLLGVPCYCDGSGMRAEEWFNILKEKGSDEIWKMMEEEYKALFGKLI